MNNYIDLHMHSMYSDDGEFTPKELVKMCHSAGVSIMAITDHNWVKAIDEEKSEALLLDIKVIPAIEIDCVFKNVNLHVLGYGIDTENSSFNMLGENILRQELESSERKLRLTNAMGFQIIEEQMNSYSSNGVYTGEMFGEALLKDERYFENDLLKPYRAGGIRSDNPYVNFYWDYYSQGKLCYTKIAYPSMEETIELIRENGGIAVLAHPGNNLKNQFHLLDEMVKKGMQGVEAFSSYHTAETNEYFYNKAKELNIVYTCGSDFHGKTKPAIHLGKTGCEFDEHEIEHELIRNNLI